MPPVRPILETFQRTPWVAKTPVDDTSVQEIIPRQVQIAVRGDGPVAQRELVALTPAARELLHGKHRESADRVLRGMLAPLDAHKGASNLRGFSLASDDAGFATNMLMSNIEAGYEPDSVAANDRAGFERTFTKVARATTVAKAQNTGWTDFGPRTSSQVLSLIEHGPAAGKDAAAEVALTAAHELQHSITPPKAPGVPQKLVWMEEGAAETLAWWPGVAGESMRRMGVPPRPGHEPDPYTVSADSVASSEYRERHRSVMALLGMAGVTPLDDSGKPVPGARERAHQLLQGDPIERAPRNLARAIGRRHGLGEGDTAALADLIVETQGRASQVDALAQALQPRR